MNARSALVIVAEGAQGFEGIPTLARLLVRGAARARADVIKFQLVYADELAVRSYRYYELFRTLEMSEEAWSTVAAHARTEGIALAFDVYGPRSLALAMALGAAAVKIHSADFFNDRLLADALAAAPRVYLSSGGIAADEIAARLTVLGDDASKVTLMCGFQAEPTLLPDTNLARLRLLRERFPSVAVGFTDHAAGDSDEAGWLGVLAVPLGVAAIEKHISLSRSLTLEDYVSALDPDAFARYVGRVRAAETAMGSSELVLSAEEEGYRRRVLKVVVATRPLAAGAAVEDGDVVLLRSPLADGRAAAERLDAVVGRRLRSAVPSGEPVYRDLIL